MVVLTNMWEEKSRPKTFFFWPNFPEFDDLQRWIRFLFVLFWNWATNMIYWKSSKIFKVQDCQFMHFLRWVSNFRFFDSFALFDTFQNIAICHWRTFCLCFKKKKLAWKSTDSLFSSSKAYFSWENDHREREQIFDFFCTKTFLRLSESETCSTARILSFHKNYEDKSQLFSDKNFIPEVIHYYSILTQFDTLNQAVSHLFLPYKLGVFLFFSFSNSFKIGHIWNKLVNFLS